MPVTQYEHIITYFNQSLVDEHCYQFFAIRSNATMTVLVAPLFLCKESWKMYYGWIRFHLDISDIIWYLFSIT